MPALRFEVYQDELVLLDAPDGFQRQRVQLRRDPLLGHTSVYNPALEGKAGLLFNAVDRAALARLVAESAPTCLFCPERLAATPKFPPELLPEGRLQMGEAILFPNLFPLAPYHAVVAVSRAHFLELEAFTPALLCDAFCAMQRFAQAVQAHDPAARYATFNANYLFPAGASLVHPHFQVLLSSRPYAQQARQIEACQAYRQAQGRDYFTDLRAAETELGERLMGRSGPWHWLAAYAPLGNHEIQALHETECDFARLAQSEIEALAQGLARVLQLYAGLGHLSFNFSLYSQAAGAGPGTPLLLRCVTRQNPAPLYRADDYFLQKLLGSELILLLPEALARQARPLFSQTR